MPGISLLLFGVVGGRLSPIKRCNRDKATLRKVCDYMHRVGHFSDIKTKSISPVHTMNGVKGGCVY